MLLLAAIVVQASLAPASPYEILFDGLKRPGQMLQTVLQLEKAFAARPAGDDVCRQALAVAYSFVGEAPRALKVFDETSFKAPPAQTFDVKDLAACRRVDALDAAVQLASKSRVVVINEAHHVPQVRTFTLQMVRRLRALGYSYYAAEAFSKPSEFSANRAPSLSSGNYTAEPVFGQIVREAVRKGYKLVPYEAETRPPAGTPPMQRMGWRENQECANLMARIFTRDPKAKVIIHCGYSHAYKWPADPDNMEWMAMRLRKALGKGLVSIDLTDMREASQEDRENSQYRYEQRRQSIRTPIALRRKDGSYWVGGEGKGKVDLQVFFPRTRLVNGRPDWLARTGRKTVRLPFKNPDAKGRFLVEAIPSGEPADAVPMDRVLIWPGRPLPVLKLPSGRYTVSVLDESGRKLLSRQLKV
jgi:hypothetical protein